MRRAPVRNVVEDQTHRDAQVYKVKQDPGTRPDTMAHRREVVRVNTIFAWGREAGRKTSKINSHYVSVEGTLADLMEAFKAQNEAAGREFRWFYGPDDAKGLATAVWALRYKNVEHAIHGTVVHGI